MLTSQKMHDLLCYVFKKVSCDSATKKSEKVHHFLDNYALYAHYDTISMQ